MRTLTPLMDYSQSAPFLDLSFQFLSFHLLIYVCTQFHLLCTTYVPSCSPLVINPFPLPRSIPLSLTVPRPQLRLSNRIYYDDRLSACRPVSNLEGQSTVIVTLTYTPRHRVPLLVAFYDLHGLQWCYSFPRSPRGDEFIG
jgi:hypothetical protein